MKTMTKRDCRNRNLICDEGFFLPFVACGDDGLIYVGDCGNIDSFSTVEEAIWHCNRAELQLSDAFNRAERAYKKRCDAELQLDALRKLQIQLQ